MIDLLNNCYAFEVSEGATDFGFINDNLVCKLPESKPGSYKWLYNADEQMTKIGGEWEIVCTSKEATEELLKEVIPELPVGQRWQNYGSDYPVWFHSRRESLRSLLASKGYDVNKNWLIFKKVFR